MVPLISPYRELSIIRPYLIRKLQPSYEAETVQLTLSLRFLPSLILFLLVCGTNY